MGTKTTTVDRTFDAVTHHSKETRGATERSVSFDDLPDAAYIRQAQLIPHVVPFSSATLWRMVKSGAFVSPKKLSMAVTAWNVGEVRAWLKAVGQ
jgi:prophage regulatory protein